VGTEGAGVRIYLSGDDVPFRVYAERTSALLKVLDELSAHHDVDAGDWIVTAAATGSMSITIAAENEAARHVHDVFLNGVEHLHHKDATIPDGWNRESLAHLSKVKQVRGRRLTVGTPGRRRRSIEVTRTVCSRAKDLSTIDEPTYYGSVIGSLDGPEQIRRLQADILIRVTGRTATVYYDVSQVAQVGEAWGKLVEITGKVVCNAKGEVRTITADTIEVLPEAVPFSSIFGLLDEDFDVDAYLEEIRG
jgi:hypothetical protein